MITDAGLVQVLTQGINTLDAQRDVAQRGYDAARREIEHVLTLLPYEQAKTGKYRTLRRRLERFLSERLDGL
jgi:hypothetical protein